MANENLVPDSILEKVQKLMALEERAGTPEEAANAASKIQGILMKYNLDLATVKNHKVDDKNVVNETYNLNDYQTSREGGFAFKLFNAIANFNFCRLVHCHRNRPQYNTNSKAKDEGDVVIIGQKHNVEVVMYMFDYCLNNVKLMFEEHWDKYTGSERRNTYRRGFYEGALYAITRRLTVQKKEAEKEFGVNNITALVKVNDAAVDTKVIELFPRLRTTSNNRTYKSNNGKAAGYEAGNKLNLSKGLGGDDKPSKRLH